MGNCLRPTKSQTYTSLTALLLLPDSPKVPELEGFSLLPHQWPPGWTRVAGRKEICSKWEVEWGRGQITTPTEVAKGSWDHHPLVPPALPERLAQPMLREGNCVGGGNSCWSPS